MLVISFWFLINRWLFTCLQLVWVFFFFFYASIHSLWYWHWWQELWDFHGIENLNIIKTLFKAKINVSWYILLLWNKINYIVKQDLLSCPPLLAVYKTLFHVSRRLPEEESIFICCPFFGSRHVYPQKPWQDVSDLLFISTVRQ